MKRVLFGVLAAGVLAATAPAAMANHKTVTGGCFFDSNSQETATNGAYVGVIGARAVVQDATGAPTSATIRCKIQVNGADATPTYSYNGTGVVAGANQISFNAAEGAAVDLCEQVDSDAWDCQPSTEIQVPPQEVIDLLVLITSIPDPIICPVLKGIFPPEGDIVLPEPIGKVWDCPPYDA